MIRAVSVHFVCVLHKKNEHPKRRMLVFSHCKVNLSFSILLPQGRNFRV